LDGPKPGRFALGRRPTDLNTSRIQALKLCAALDLSTVTKIQNKLAVAWENIDDPADKASLIDLLIANPTRAEEILDQLNRHLAAGNAFKDYKLT
jgi:hypothetical protein